MGEVWSQVSVFHQACSWQPYLMGKTALLHAPLCSVVAKRRVDWEPVMQGLLLQLESHWRSNPSQPIKLHELKLKKSKSFISGLCFSWHAAYFRGKKSAIHCVHTTMFPASQLLCLWILLALYSLGNGYNVHKHQRSRHMRSALGAESPSSFMPNLVL